MKEELVLLLLTCNRIRLVGIKPLKTTDKQRNNKCLISIAARVPLSYLFIANNRHALVYHCHMMRVETPGWQWYCIGKISHPQLRHQTPNGAKGE